MVARKPLPSTWAPGSLIPATVYRVIRPIGQGGMGEVYEVEHDMLGTRRALKVLVRHYAGREDLAERLRVEARGLARLKHPNLVEVYDLGTAADGRIFFAMELLDGVTLRAMLRDRGRLSVRTSVELVMQVLAGLQAAHTAGILHRDVKPENVFVCRDGTVKLLDFGVAKAIDAWLPDQQITARGMTVGTPRYMSPEQAEGGPVDGRTDVYATGQVLWEMLAGRPAFEETDLYELAQAKWRGVTLLSDLPGVDAPPALCAAVDQACQPDPKNRFASAAAFLQALRLALVEADTPLTPGPSSTQAYLVHASEAAPDPTADTAFDPRGVRSPNAPASGAVVSELTERVEAVNPVNRDALTQAHRQGLVPRGPGGTEVLPAIASRQQVAQRAAPSAPPTRSASPPARKKAAAKRPVSLLGIPVMSWFAGASAFFVPVFVATAIGYWQFRSPRSATPRADPPVSAPEFSSEPSSEPAASAWGDSTATDASAPAASSAPAIASSASAPTVTAPPPVATPRTTRTSKGDSTAKAPPAPSPSPAVPAPTPTRKMPGSGL